MLEKYILSFKEEKVKMAEKKKRFKTIDAVNASLILAQFYGFRKVNENISTKSLCEKVLMPKGKSEEFFSLFITNEVEASEYLGENSENEFKTIKDRLISHNSDWSRNVFKVLDNEYCGAKDFGLIASSVAVNPRTKNFQKASIKKGSYLEDVTAIVVRDSSPTGVSTSPKKFYDLNLIIPEMKTTMVMEKIPTEFVYGELHYGDVIKFDGDNTADKLFINNFYKTEDYTYTNEFVKDLFIN